MFVCPYGTRGYRLRDGCSIFAAEVEAINKALTYVKVSTRKSFVIFSDCMSVLQAIVDEILCRLDEILCRLDEILCRLDDLIFKYACPFSASVLLKPRRVRILL